MSRSGSSSRAGKGAAKGGRNPGNAMLPAIRGSFTGTKRIRYQVSHEAPTYDFIGTPVYSLGPTGMDGIGAAYAIATNTTAAALLFASYRLVAVEIWGATSSTGSSVGIEFAGSSSDTISSPSVYYENVAMGVTPAHLRVIPPDGSMASMWFNNTVTPTAQKLCQIWANAGSFIDVTIEYTLCDTNAVIHSTSVAHSVGDILAGTLDSNAYIIPWDFVNA